VTAPARLCIGHGGDVGEPSGGTERVSALASGLSERGVDVTLVVPQPSGALPDRLDAVAVEFVDPPAPSAVVRAAATARAAARVARRRDATLQLEHSTLAGVGTLVGVEDFVLDMHDLAHGRFEHASTPVAPLLARGVGWLERRAVASASRVVTVSASMADTVAARWGVPRDSVTVVPNGHFPETVAAADGASVRPGRVAFLGTLHPKVDVDALLAVARLPSVSDLVVVGDGAQRARLERAADEVSALRVTGRLPDAEAFRVVAEAAAVVNPQSVSSIQRSSSPVKLYYYAALGKPMVVTPGPDVVAAFVRRGAAVTARSRRHFTDRVDDVLTDDAFAARLSRNARAAASDLTWTARVEALADSYGGVGG
jgi:glycosyltransferase involved in cell wall biosynthesis